MSRRSIDHDESEQPLPAANAERPDTTATEQLDRQLTQQLNVLITEAMHGALKAWAAARGCALAEVVRAALASAVRDSEASAGGRVLVGGEAAVSAAAKLDAQAYQHLVRVGGNLNQAMRAINSGRGDVQDWPVIVEAARAVIALKRQVAGLPPATLEEEAAAILAAPRGGGGIHGHATAEPAPRRWVLDGDLGVRMAWQPRTSAGALAACPRRGWRP